MRLSVLLPLLVFTAILVGFFLWYRSTIKEMRPDADARQLPGARLTAERLRMLSSPPWRVVYEIGAGHLGPLDHVVIGPSGVLGIETLMIDRPGPAEPERAAQLMADAAIKRTELDELCSRVGLSCDRIVRVHWGEPQPDEPAGIEVTTGLIAVEGQRLSEWFLSLPPGPLSAAQVDLAWQTVTTGIGRPDPLG